MGSDPRVGIGCIIVDGQDRLLVGKRKGSHGAGTWQLPGGHLDYGEQITDCAVRETLEETGLRVRGVKIVAVNDNVFPVEEKHYVTLFVWCEMMDDGAEPELMEPHKCESWHWKSWEQLKHLRGDSSLGEVVFRPLHKLLDQTPDLNHLRPESVGL